LTPLQFTAAVMLASLVVTALTAIAGFKARRRNQPALSDAYDNVAVPFFFAFVFAAFGLGVAVLLGVSQ
jgi:phosphoglycerol transferase MdoB-like AlkP superfamily enzyme